MEKNFYQTPVFKLIEMKDLNLLCNSQDGTHESYEELEW